MSEEMKEVYDRLRETEATNREQNARIDNLIDKLDSLQGTVNRAFSTIEEKDRRSDERFNKFLSVIEERNKKDDERYDKQHKLLVFVIGALIAVVLGPKTSEKLMDAWRNGGAPIGAINCDVKPWDDQKYFPYHIQHNEEMV